MIYIKRGKGIQCLSRLNGLRLITMGESHVAACYNGNNAPHALSPKGSFWWRDDYKEMATLAMVNQLSYGNILGIILQWRISPHLHSFVRNEKITMEMSLTALGNIFLLYVPTSTIYHCSHRA